MNPYNLVDPVQGKHPSIGMDKIGGLTPTPQNVDSLVQWANLYFAIHVLGTPKKTEAAKHKDLEKFIDFFQREMGTDHGRLDAGGQSTISKTAARRGIGKYRRAVKSHHR